MICAFLFFYLSCIKNMTLCMVIILTSQAALSLSWKVLKKVTKFWATSTRQYIYHFWSKFNQMCHPKYFHQYLFSNLSHINSIYSLIWNRKSNKFFVLNCRGKIISHNIANHDVWLFDNHMWQLEIILKCFLVGCIEKYNLNDCMKIENLKLLNEVLDLYENM